MPKKPPKKKVKPRKPKRKSPPPKRGKNDFQAASGILLEGAPIVPPPSNPSVPVEQIKQAGHWDIRDDEMEDGGA